MANPEHLEIIKKGVEHWNKWRNEDLEIRPNLYLVDLSEANLRGANFYRTMLSGANLRGADLRNAFFSEANLKGADLSEATLIRAHLSETDLSHVGLSGANLHGADLSEANLKKANLSKANLNIANLSYTTLVDTDLSGAMINGATLFGADLRGADLNNAYLTRSYLCEAYLSSVNFNRCTIGKTSFGLTDLSSAKNLDSVFVEDECSIDFQTLRDSKGLSKDFLFKIGLPENYINYLPDFYDENPIRLFPVFLSHSWANKDFAHKLYNALIKHRVQVWYDKKQLMPGDGIFEGITKGINVYDKMILVCSKDSLNSWWVNQEMNRILKKEREYQKVNDRKMNLLIPITIDDEIYNWDGAKAESIKDKVIGDFREWKDDIKFEESLNQLIEALNVDRGNESISSYL
jgi:uncharacterized protein YjbI with pentapeptide repeats